MDSGLPATVQEEDQVLRVNSLVGVELSGCTAPLFLVQLLEVPASECEVTVAQAG